MKGFLAIFLCFIWAGCYSQEQALEIYVKKDPSKRFIVKVDDKVLVTCKNKETGEMRMVVARLAVVDSGRLDFYPVNKNYRHRIYTIPALNEIGVKTTYRKVLAAYIFISRVFKRRYFDLYDEEDSYSYKMVNIRSKKWSARIINL